MYVDPLVVAETWSMIYRAAKLIRRLNKQYPASPDVNDLQQAMWDLADILPRELVEREIPKMDD